MIYVVKSSLYIIKIMKTLIFLCFSAGIAKESNDFDKYSDPGDCICDLTSNSCDEFCCCDPDCKSTFSWSDCAAESFSSFSQEYCADTTEIFRINKRRGMDTVSSSSSSEKCVKIDNSAKIEGFHSLVSSVSTSTVSERVTDTYTYADSFVEVLSDKSLNYVVGDVVSQFNIAVPDINGVCVQTGPGFLKDFNGTCVVVGNLKDICTGYLDVPLTDFNSKKYVFRDYDTGVESSLNSASTTYSSETCKNALVAANFEVTVSGLNTVAIDKIDVVFYVTDISSSSSASVIQAFKVKFFTSSSPTLLSGNPGYQKMKPLKVQTGTNTHWLTINGKSAKGACSSTSISGETVNFGSAFEYSCYYSMNYESLKSYCPSVDVSQIAMFRNLFEIEKIGKWGNSQNSNSDDWVTIDKSGPGSSSLSGAVCTLSKVLVLDVYYAEIGSFNNPQSKVVLAKMYYKTGTWVYTGSGTQRFLYSLFVNYIPYDTDYDPYYSKPRKDLIMPQNVLDPFRTSSSQYLFVSFLVWAKLIYITLGCLELATSLRVYMNYSK